MIQSGLRRQIELAEVVFGACSSHTPMLSMSPEQWPEMGRLFDPRLPDFGFEERVAKAPDWLSAELRPQVMQDKHAAAQRAIEVLRIAMREVAPDVVVIIGNDQEEMFLEYTPMFALMKAAVVRDVPADTSQMLAAHQESAWAYHGDELVEYPVSESLNDHLIKVLSDRHFDIAVCTGQTSDRSLGHAFTFIQRRIMTDFSTPIVPVMINTYYPPNQAAPARCIEFGAVIGEALASWPKPARVAVVASGGLSHFAVEADLDKEIIRHLADENFEALAKIPREELKLGTSESLNWITAARILAAHGRKMHLVDYVPAYRSMAGSGVGLAFSTWS